jgi:predicted flap endonuclease-1-like 5' DNA nuclease
MNWLIFLGGIAVGWVLEWVVDLLFWRRRQKKWVAAESDYLSQLAEVRTELEGEKQQAAALAAAGEADLEAARTDGDALRSQVATAEADSEALRSQLAAAEAERDRLAAELASVDAERQTLADRFGGLSGLAATAPAAAGVALVAMSRGEPVDLEDLKQGAGDDLTMIEGVGPKIQELLYQNGIHTYSELADCDVERLRSILAGGGTAFRLADPSNWPRQARLAAAHDWVRLQVLKQQLTGGVRRAVPEKPAPEQPPQPDDLTMIEGVGPKIQELLYQNGIHTYAELADCDVERLQAILAGGGAAFRMADPSSWPRQARLAGARDWVRLQTLKQQLSGGVRRPAEPPPEDDLTLIEGIGPKISASLKEHGIRTFAQLARTDAARLQEILAEGGPAFKLAAPAVESWPEQARLAADGAWDELHALRDMLNAGRAGAGEPGPAAEPGEIGEPGTGPEPGEAGEPGLGAKLAEIGEPGPEPDPGEAQ